MKKITKILLIICESLVVISVAGVLSYGLKVSLSFGFLSFGVMLLLAFIAIYYTKKKNGDI